VVQSKEVKTRSEEERNTTNIVRASDPAKVTNGSKVIALRDRPNN
jgi:hypothetical protein